MQLRSHRICPTKTSELDGLTGKAKWTEDGECDKEPKAFEIQDGAYVEME